MAHGHGHEHGHSKLELPDYRQWKIEGTPLETVQERLAARGLRDPWGRNEAWRYMGGFAHNYFSKLYLDKKQHQRSETLTFTSSTSGHYYLHQDELLYASTDITVSLVTVI
ncbi:NADH dehydrogenase [ubiquinone] 1 beta subcomplex subunit 3-like [Mustela nigripes]|uniref:NADH dehydrogenase [ubiquinone] 1 beta subcomplex subunit 3-like n=1 Tax=Mustela nigripes TaxID=77151 RepID=UPI002814EF97|nr:NADH dehydrogenase [ubiquinone] 1 beta subcomplex subunit 3-like [Mustela nigripes]